MDRVLRMQNSYGKSPLGSHVFGIEKHYWIVQFQKRGKGQSFYQNIIKVGTIIDLFWFRFVHFKRNILNLTFQIIILRYKHSDNVACSKTRGAKTPDRYTHTHTHTHTHIHTFL